MDVETEYPNAPRLIEWVQLREKARIEGRSGDPNIDNWRYCNVRRQHDRVTAYVRQWLSSWDHHKLLVPNALMARLFNQPTTLSRIGFIEEWNPQHVRNAVNDLLQHNLRVFNPAYIVSTNGRKMDKVDYLCEYVLDPAFRSWGKIDGTSLDELWESLHSLNGVGSFIAAQVVADLKFTERWVKADDWFTFVAPGPGSMRGMNRLRGLAPNDRKYNRAQFSMAIQPVRRIIGIGTGINLCAQDTQNCLCEFDKYMRLVTGEGRPKQTYKRT
jgi:hypothetical protein